MRNIGYVGIAFSAMNSANEIHRACSVGRTNECKQVKFRAIGKFTGEIAGAVKGSSLCIAMGISGPWSTVGCFIGLSIIGAEVGALLGESAGNILYSVTEKTNEHL